MIQLTNEQEELLRWFNLAVEGFNRHEQYLITRKVNEQCVCAKLASYMERVLYLSPFRGYFVDVEYNRGHDGNEYSPKVDPETLHNISLDFIVHKRGQDEEQGFINLLCMEMKKSDNLDALSNDLRRLKFLTEPYGHFQYKLGVMMIENVCPNEDKKIWISHLAINGIVHEL